MMIQNETTEIDEYFGSMKNKQYCPSNLMKLTVQNSIINIFQDKQNKQFEHQQN